MTSRFRSIFAAGVAAAWLTWAAPATAQKGETKPTAPGGAIPTGGAYEFSEVEEPPHLQNAREVERQIARHYPRALRRAGVTGEVRLRFRIATDGSVDPSSLRVESSTNAAFEEPAATAAVRMRFSPATLGGRPVAVWVSVPIMFGLENVRPRKPSP
ncbi:MAG: energy transducer TonB [Longimicrobiaceae bacterium]